MLSRRDKLLIQPWEERRFREHRIKVTCALPAIDVAPPPQRPHVSIKLKKSQKEEDRKAKIEKDNFCLLQRLSMIMKVNRLDNHWLKPQPNFHHKVGLYFPADKLNAKLKLEMPTNEQNEQYCRNVKCIACEIKNNKKAPEDIYNLRLEYLRST